MKIVRIDNYDRENRDEKLVAENIQNRKEACIMIEALRNSTKRAEDDWYKMMDDNYILYKFEP